MKLNEQQMQDIINSIVPEWAAQELQYYKERAKKVPKATGIGQSNISVNTIKATADNVAQIMFSFMDYMRYMDMKKLDRTKAPPYDEIINWIEAKGVQKFRAGFVRKYGRVPTDDKKLMNAIAWGIIKSKNRKHRQRKWYNKAKWVGINVLEDKLRDAISETLLNSISNELKQ